MKKIVAILCFSALLLSAAGCWAGQNKEADYIMLGLE